VQKSKHTEGKTVQEKHLWSIEKSGTKDFFVIQNKKSQAVLDGGDKMVWFPLVGRQSTVDIKNQRRHYTSTSRATLTSMVAVRLYSTTFPTSPTCPHTLQRSNFSC